MEQRLRHIPDTDDAVVRAYLVGALHPESLCCSTLRSISISLMEDSDCEAFFALLGAALYTDAALYADATLYADPAPSIGATPHIDTEAPL